MKVWLELFNALPNETWQDKAVSELKKGLNWFVDTPTPRPNRPADITSAGFFYCVSKSPRRFLSRHRERSNSIERQSLHKSPPPCFIGARHRRQVVIAGFGASSGF